MSDKNNSGLEVVAWESWFGDERIGLGPTIGKETMGMLYRPLVRLSGAEAALASAKKEIAGWVKISEAEDEFNTSLVAVNAELVEALRYCVEALQDNLYADDYLTTLAVARAALLKAEGAKP